MLEHLGMGSLKKPSKDSNENHEHTSNNIITSNSTTTTVVTPPRNINAAASTAKTYETINASNMRTIKVNGNGNDDVVDKISVVINDDDSSSIGKRDGNAVKDTHQNDMDEQQPQQKFNPKKRYSIPAPACAHENGDTKHRSRDLSPIPPRNMQRKLSQDLRIRGSNSHINDENMMELAKLKRPVKLKSITTNFESYDSLHAKVVEVSTFFFF